MPNEETQVRGLIEELWAQADGELLEGNPLFVPLPDYESPEHNADLRYLNSHWQLDPTAETASDAAALKSKAKDRFNAAVLGVLHRYFEQEREFLAHSVRVSNLLAGWSDRLAREVRELAQGLTDESHRLRDRQDVLHRRLEDRIAELEARVQELES